VKRKTATELHPQHDREAFSPFFLHISGSIVPHVSKTSYGCVVCGLCRVVVYSCVCVFIN